MPRTHSARRRDWKPYLPWLVIAAGLWAYQNSFTTPFLFDDVASIVANPRIQRLWPLGGIVASSLMRPVVDLSFAINYALGGLNPIGYHAVNLAIHLTAGLLLYGIVRRTLRPQRPWLALGVALLWVVHPLQTQSVTYVTQRAESLMGLWYLLTLYGVIRGAASSRPRGWYAAAVLVCAAGMGSKPVMITAPVIVLLYDRAFLSRSVRGALRRRAGLYRGLASTWVVLVLLLVAAPRSAALSAGITIEGLSPWDYALSQPGVILHYVRLACWPHPLVFDYAWPVARTIGAILPSMLAIGGLVLGTCWAWRGHPALGFLGAWYFLILAPTSSVMPLLDLAFEHRLYLPLAAVIVLVVLGADQALARLCRGRKALRRVAGPCLVASAVAALGVMTIRRNAEYRSPLVIWLDTVAKRPQNPRAHGNLGVALELAGQPAAAATEYRAALSLMPSYAEAHNNLGRLLAGEGRFAEAVIHYEAAVRFKRHFPSAHNNLGVALTHLGRVPEAIAQYQAALQLRPDYARAHYNLANVLRSQGRMSEAIAHYEAAVRFKPRWVAARERLEEIRPSGEPQARQP